MDDIYNHSGGWLYPRRMMRTEAEMLDLILRIAKLDERIRAVILNGSRANPNAPGDIFQDFDVVYGVTEVEPFKYDFDWIAQFGELMIMQMPEDMQEPSPADDGSFAYLMQFADGNRIDLSLVAIKDLLNRVEDSLSLLLLDKDGVLGPFPPASERDYLPVPPTPKAFDDCCNEFWWVCPYVAKGLWRAEILYAKHMMDHYVRDQLMKMLEWYIGVKTEYAQNPGKNGKYFQRHLSHHEWSLLMKTYSDAGYERTWEALFHMCDLFRDTALAVAGHFGFEYPYTDDENVSNHLVHVRNLPRDAAEMYG
jgi:aminoglycoside 6-adenylyltransferase